MSADTYINSQIVVATPAVAEYATTCRGATATTDEL